jgi:hypothetical protein
VATLVPRITIEKRTCLELQEALAERSAGTDVRQDDKTAIGAFHGDATQIEKTPMA